MAKTGVKTRVSESTGRVLLPYMDANERLRKRVLRLVNRGINQKQIALAMGMKPATFNKWLHNRAGIKPPTVLALEGFERFVLELSKDLSEETQRAEAPAGATFHSDQRPKTGTGD